MVDVIGRTIGLYQVVEEIGSGPMGTVYKAYRPVLKRHVAIKILLEPLSHDHDMVARFQHGATAAARLLHPNIVPVYDVGEDEGLYFVAMDYIAGPTLAQKLVADGPLPPDAALAILRQVGTALAYAHANGVVHGNLKPSNILFTREGQAILTDFVATGDPVLQATHSLAGAPAYLSPEQVEGRELDRRSDLYSLGIVLFEMLTARVPFEGETRVATLHKQARERPPAPSSLVPSIPKTVDKVVLRALNKEKEKRFASAPEMVRALARAIGAPAERAPRESVLPLGRAATATLFTCIALVAVLAARFALFRPAGSHSLPTPTSTMAPTPTVAATSVPPTPSPTVTSSPTASPAPTVTPVPPSETPPPTPTTLPVVVLPTVAAVPTVTPIPTLAAAPILVSPLSGSGLSGPTIHFRWSWGRPLQPGEHFDLRVSPEGVVHRGIAWTQEPAYDLRSLAPGYYRWSIVVIREAGRLPDGSPGWEPVSQESAIWDFTYVPPTATPSPPP